MTGNNPSLAPGLIERYRDRLPVTAATPVVTLGEGSTPLLEAPRVSERSGCNVYLKYEGANPTGSFKDRGMTVAVSKALEAAGDRGRVRVHGQHLGLGRGLLRPRRHPGRGGGAERETALGKLAQAQVVGATVSPSRGLRRRAAARPRAVLSGIRSRSPTRQPVSGSRVRRPRRSRCWSEHGSAPDWLALPVGNAGNITAYWWGSTSRGPAATRAGSRLLGCQAAGAAPLRQGTGTERPDTVATAIRIGIPARSTRRSGGPRVEAGAVRCRSDERSSPGTAARAGGGGVLRAVHGGEGGRPARGFGRRVRRAGSTVVCVLTGHGLNDPDTAGSEGTEILRCPPQIEQLELIAFAKEPVLA